MRKKTEIALKTLLIIFGIGLLTPAYGQTTSSLVSEFDQRLIRQLTSQDAVERGLAACHLGERRISAAIPGLINLLGDKEPIDLVACGERGEWKAYAPPKSSTPGKEAAQSLGNIGVPAAPRLITALGGEYPHARSNAALALGFMRHAEALNPLLSALNDQSSEVRGRVIFALVYLKSDKAILPLITALSDENKDVRKQAAWALGALKARQALDALIIAMSDEFPVVRQRAVWALGQINDQLAIEPLIAALADEDELVRSKAAYWLGSKRAIRAAGDLSGALKDSSASVRKYAAWALGLIGNSAAIPALKLALKDSAVEVRKNAGEAIELIKRKGIESNPSMSSLVIRNTTLIDGTGQPPVSNMTIVIVGNQIATVSQNKKVRVSRNARIIDGTNLYVIPGMWDMHVHLSKSKASALPILVANGVTSVRDMGGDLKELLFMREQVRKRNIVGPRIKLAGPSLESPASVQRAKAKGSKENFDRTRIVVEGPDDAKRIVDKLKDLGVDFIKIRTYASVETFNAILKAAKSAGISIVGHPAYDFDPVDLSNLGLASLEHGFYPYPPEKYSAKERENIIDAFVRNKTALVPTLITWQPRTIPYESVEAIVEDEENKLDTRRKYLSKELLEDWREQLVDRKNDSRSGVYGWQDAIDKVAKDTGDMFRKGVIVMPGSDLAGLLIYPGPSLHDELEIFVKKAGMTPMQAIESATRVPSEFFGMQDSLGTLEKGKLADLVLLNANPLEDINNIRRIRAVVVDGKYFEKKELE